METLLNQSTVWLFGRVMEDVEINHSVYASIPVQAGPGQGDPDVPEQADDTHNNLLLSQLRADSRIARIYAFSFEGVYYELARPALFVVHGPGLDPEGAPSPSTPRHVGRGARERGALPT